MKRVLVIGAGPAGLAAGVRLLERASRTTTGQAGSADIRVTIAHMGHHIGGKAASYVDANGRMLEHGWHMFVGFYRNLPQLLERAGGSIPNAVRRVGGKSHVFEPSRGKVFTLDSAGGRVATALHFAGYEGLSIGDHAHYSRFMAETYSLILAGEPLERHDDVCFTRWAIEHGLMAHLTRTSLFRIFRDGYFNFPEQVSAYHTLKTMKYMSSSEGAEIYAAAGPYSERVWAPIAKYFESLGGVFLPYTMVRGLRYEGPKITALHVARPDPNGHAHGATSWQSAELPIEAGTEHDLEDFDVVISTIPQAVFVTLNRDDARMWGSPYFSRMKNLRSAATVSMTVRTKKPVLSFPGPVFGLPAPLGIATNMTPYLDRYRLDHEEGNEVQFVGQEKGFESWTDDEIAAFTLDNLTRVPGGDLRAAEITYLELHRNKSDFERIFLCEPGVQQFRPGSRTPFDNLFLAGDWVRNEVDLVCMEGAVTSGYEAADHAIACLAEL